MLSPYYPNAIAKAVAFFLLISSPSAPELMFELMKYSPVPPPAAVLLYNFVIAVAVGVLAAAENVMMSFMTICPVPLAFSSKFPFDASLVIEVIFVRSLSVLTVIVSSSDPAVLIFCPPTYCKIWPEATEIAVESSPATFKVKELDDVST